MTGMERNSDLVERSCYAPLFVNVNQAGNGQPKAWQWDSDLIGYTALKSYGSPSYYVQKMFGSYLGTKVVPITAENAPLRKPAVKDTAGISHWPANARRPKAERPALFFVCTQDAKNIYLKVVNTDDMAQETTISLKGGDVAANGTLVVLKGDKPEDTNTIDEPTKIVPVTSTITGLGRSFKHTFQPYSVNVIRLSKRK
jgi:alpha-N-arabinofuranosidase